MSQERFDVVLRVLSGPHASTRPEVFHGPVVNVGSQPGAGGLRLQRVRGVAHVHCKVAAYGPTASVTALGTHQVRVGPHANVRWSDLEPIIEPTVLSPGCAIHVGPVGRGATIEFVETRRLGAWERDQLASGPEAEEAPQVRAERVVRTSTLPVWFVGCAVLILAATASSVLLAGIALYVIRDVGAPGRMIDGEELYASVEIPEEGADPTLLEGLAEPYRYFVMEPNIQAAGGAPRHQRWQDPAAWDQRFFAHVTSSVEQHKKYGSVFSPARRGSQRVPDRGAGTAKSQAARGVRRHSLSRESVPGIRHQRRLREGVVAVHARSRESD